MEVIFVCKRTRNHTHKNHVENLKNTIKVQSNKDSCKYNKYNNKQNTITYNVPPTTHLDSSPK